MTWLPCHLIYTMKTENLCLINNNFIKIYHRDFQLSYLMQIFLESNENLWHAKICCCAKSVAVVTISVSVLEWWNFMQVMKPISEIQSWFSKSDINFQVKFIHFSSENFSFVNKAKLKKKHHCCQTIVVKFTNRWV